MFNRILIGDTSSNGGFPIAMLVYQRVVFQVSFFTGFVRDTPIIFGEKKTPGFFVFFQ